MSNHSVHRASAGAALEYASPPPRGRSRPARAAALLLVLVLTFAGYRWGGAAWHQARVLYWQRQCLNYRPAANDIVYEEEPGTTVWKRLGVSLLSLLPIEWLL